MPQVFNTASAALYVVLFNLRVMHEGKFQVRHMSDLYTVLGFANHRYTEQDSFGQ